MNPLGWMFQFAFCSPARENRWSKLLTVISFSSVASPKDVSNPAQHRIAWFCHSKIAGNIIREAISEHPARAGRETIPATGERA